MRHGSLFSGIGGFDLAAEWMGWENIFHCEWNKFGQQVLKYYWPKAISYEDITKTDFTIHRGNIDIITGGFPCQPYSSAGKRLGKEDERHLWPEMLRAIREVQPSWVVGENVRGLTNWNGGMVFDEVQAELEAQGYEVLPFLLPACAVNAPHRRDRIWFVAHSKSNGWNGRERKQRERIEINQWEFCEHKTKGWDEIRAESQRYSKEGNASNTNGNGLNECNGNNEVNTSERGFNALGYINEGNGDGDVADTLRIRSGESWERRQSEQFDEDGIERRVISNPKSIRQEYALENGELEGRRLRQPNKRNAWDSFPSVSPICIGDDGLSDRLDSITFPKWRQESIKAGGNAIVPQVVHQIFKAIQEYERIATANTD
jgi:DNA (cytosine-5)-methyltransferase 1